MLALKFIRIIPLFLLAATTFQTMEASPPPATAPTAIFTGSPGTPYVNQKVQFSNTSTGNPTSWLWNFGDGQTGTSKDANHI